MKAITTDATTAGHAPAIVQAKVDELDEIGRTGREQLPGWSTNPDDYEVVDGELREKESILPKGEPVASPAEAPASAATRRDYGVYQELKLDLEKPNDLAMALKKIAGEGTELVVLARVGVGTGTNPRSGLTDAAQSVALDGSYEVIALKSITHFDKVKSELKPSLSIG